MLSILSSFVVAFIFFPLYKWVLKKTKKENLSALIISLLIIIIITVPTLVIINSITREATDVYSYLTIKLTEDKELIGIECHKDSTLCNAVGAINNNPKIRFYVSGAITQLSSSITRNTSGFLFSIPKRIIDVLVIFLLVFFLFKDGELLWGKTKELVRLKPHNKNKILQKLSNTIYGVVYGYLIIALFEAIIGWAAFAIIGSKIAILIGIVIGILALIPMIGASIIWVPAAIIYFISGGIMQAIVLMIAGIIIIFLDMWVRAAIIGSRTEIHPAIVALGVLGGIMTFGPVGVVIGPLILSILLTSFEIFEIEKNNNFTF